MQRFKLYMIFIITFAVMHGTGVMVKELPYIVNAFITVSGVLVTLVLLERWYSGKSPVVALRQLGFRRTRPELLGPGIAIALLLVLFYPLFAAIAKVRVFLADDWFFNLIGLSLTAGLAEEAFFRGFVFGHLREHLIFRKAAWESLILFSLTHLALFGYFDWSIALFSTLLAIGSSIPLAYLYERAHGTIGSPALVHTTIRTIGLIVATSGEAFDTMVHCWITACLIIPNVVLAFSNDFRSIWKSQTLKINYINQ